MARARNIKPKFFQNDELGELDPLARLLFIGLWTVADFRGCLEFRPKRLKAQLLPYDDCDLEQLVKALDNYGFIAIYTVQGQQYIKVLKFEKHQNPHKNERESGTSVPDIDKSSLGIEDLDQDGKDRDKDGTHPADSLLLNPDSLNLNPEPGLPSTTSSPSDDVRQCPAGALVDMYHALMPLNPRVKVLNTARRSAIKARWNEAASLECEPFGYATKSAGIEAWRKFFEICSESKFLTGMARPTPGKPAFIADIDFIFSASGFAKTIENKYHRDAT